MTITAYDPATDPIEFRLRRVQAAMEAVGWNHHAIGRDAYDVIHEAMIDLIYVARIEGQRAAGRAIHEVLAGNVLVDFANCDRSPESAFTDAWSWNTDPGEVQRVMAAVDSAMAAEATGTGEPS
jgi:hypothetical protein